MSHVERADQLDYSACGILCAHCGDRGCDRCPSDWVCDEEEIAWGSLVAFLACRRFDDVWADHISWQIEVFECEEKEDWA